MKLKSYLIGVGVGLIVAALCMGTSARVKEKAAEPKPTSTSQTMYEAVGSMSPKPSQNVAEVTTEPPTPGIEPTGEPTTEVSNVPTAEVTAEPTEEPTPVATPEPTAEPTPVVTPEPTKEPTADPTKEPQGIDTPENMVLITVAKGDNSYDICCHLKDAGLIENALDYDNYLCRENYDNKIRSGNYYIPAGSSYEEIAKILIKK